MPQLGPGHSDRPLAPGLRSPDRRTPHDALRSAFRARFGRGFRPARGRLGAPALRTLPRPCEPLPARSGLPRPGPRHNPSPCRCRAGLRKRRACRPDPGHLDGTGLRASRSPHARTHARTAARTARLQTVCVRAHAPKTLSLSRQRLSVHPGRPAAHPTAAGWDEELPAPDRAADIRLPRPGRPDASVGYVTISQYSAGREIICRARMNESHRIDPARHGRTVRVCPCLSGTIVSVSVRSQIVSVSVRVCPFVCLGSIRVIRGPSAARCLNCVSPTLARPAEGPSMGRMTRHQATPRRLGPVGPDRDCGTGRGGLVVRRRPWAGPTSLSAG